MPFPLIGSFLVSAVGSVVGRTLWQLWESRDAGAAPPPARPQPGAAPFANVLKEQSQRFAAGARATATDLPPARAALPTAPVTFVGPSLRSSTSGSGSPLSEIQTA
jgi:hypothetical protein